MWVRHVLRGGADRRREIGRNELGLWDRREEAGAMRSQPQQATVTQSPFEMVDLGLADAICFLYPPLPFAQQRTEVVTNKSHSVHWWTRRSNQSTLKESNPDIHWKDWCWRWSSNTLATWCEQLTIGKDPNAGKDWRQEEKGTTEEEMVEWHHWLNGHEFEQASGVGDGQGSLTCCSPWGHKELDTTWWLNNKNNSGHVGGAQLRTFLLAKALSEEHWSNSQEHETCPGRKEDLRDKERQLRSAGVLLGPLGGRQEGGACVWLTHPQESQTLLHSSLEVGRQWEGHQ